MSSVSIPEIGVPTDTQNSLHRPGLVWISAKQTGVLRFLSA
jgi:hypothetical protein